MHNGVDCICSHTFYVDICLALFYSFVFVVVNMKMLFLLLFYVVIHQNILLCLHDFDYLWLPLQIQYLETKILPFRYLEVS